MRNVLIELNNYVANKAASVALPIPLMLQGHLKRLNTHLRSK